MLGDKSLAKGAMRAAGMPLVPGSEGRLAERRTRRAAWPPTSAIRCCSRRPRAAAGAACAPSPSPRSWRPPTRRRRPRPRRRSATAGCTSRRSSSTPITSRCRCSATATAARSCVGERECSVQRRHQKLLEESPSPFLSDDARARLYDAALGAVRATRYRNAGTIECLLGGDQSFYFMEMNTRLQVEHPVSEEVTGIDLVRSQLRLASGEPLPAPGHRADARPRDRVPHQRGGSGARVHAVARARCAASARRSAAACASTRTATRATPCRRTYDSLVAKLIVSDDDRPSALARAAQALAEFEVEGIATTLPLFREMVTSEPGIPLGRRTPPPTSKRRRGGYPRCPRDDRYPAACGLAAPGAPRGLRPDLPARRAGRVGSRRAGRALPGRHRHGGAGLHARGGRGRAARSGPRSTPPSTGRRRAGRPTGWARSSARSCGSRRGSCAAASCPLRSSSTRPSSSRSAMRGPRRRRS